MQTTLLKAVKAYKAINDLGEEKLDFKTAHTLLLAKRELEPHVQFYVKEEGKLVEEYAIKGEDGKIAFNGGQFQLHADKLEEYNRKHGELDGMEIEIELKNKALPSLEQITISALEALSEIFEFPEERSDKK